MVLESTVSNTELSEFFGPHRAPGRELRKFLSAYYLWVKANTEFFAELAEFAAKLSEFSLPKQYSRNGLPPVSHIDAFLSGSVHTSAPQGDRGLPCSDSEAPHDGDTQPCLNMVACMNH